jgi:hypothetical protein
MNNFIHIINATIKKAKDLRILPEGEEVLLNFGLTIAGELKLDELHILDSDYFDAHNEFPKFI